MASPSAIRSSYDARQEALRLRARAFARQEAAFERARTLSRACTLTKHGDPPTVGASGEAASGMPCCCSRACNEEPEPRCLKLAAAAYIYLRTYVTCGGSG